jgi:hypothetical protein
MQIESHAVLAYGVLAYGVLTYLRQDHLGSTVYTTNRAGVRTVRQGYRAYGRWRLGGTLPTDYRFTG